MRPLKRWRYVGVFDERVMLCAADVHVGPARQTFWAVLDRASGRLTGGTRLIPRRSRLDLSPGRVHLHDGAVRAELALVEEDGFDATCGPVWTRKQAGVRAMGTLRIGAGPPVELDARAVIDDTRGRHARVTEWRWAAGVGAEPDGTPLAFNLVEGVNDPPTGSERAVWVGGVPHEAGPVRFADDLTEIVAEDGSRLRFAAEAQRRRRDNLLLVRSDYLARFGSVAGALPGGIAIERALGVVEHHRARW